MESRPDLLKSCQLLTTVLQQVEIYAAKRLFLQESPEIDALLFTKAWSMEESFNASLAFIGKHLNHLKIESWQTRLD